MHPGSMRFHCLFLFALTLTACTRPDHPVPTPSPPPAGATWHQQLDAQGVYAWPPPTNAVATDGPLAHDQLRISPRYAVRIRPAAPAAAWQTATVYGSVPRNGQPRASQRPDGAEFAVAAGLTMSWASALYQTAVDVEIERIDGRPFAGTNAVTLRPTTLNFAIQQTTPTRLRIRVPYRETGYRFSVEFEDDLITTYNDGQGSTGQLTTNPTPYAVHTEPRHALLLFLQPPAVAPPQPTDGVIATIPPGSLDPDRLPDADILVFQPGLHRLPPRTHAYLPARTRWLHLQPGAYIKGAFEFRGEQTDYRVTGYGVISGEAYVYEADRRAEAGHTPYTQRSDAFADCHGSCVRLLQFWSSAHPQTLRIDGVTLANPPYHTLTVFGDTKTFSNQIRHLQQVGSWYWQSDGPELFPQGTLQHSFLHANDDAIKLYHSDVRVQDVVVWKGENGAIFQWGWIPRTVRRVRVSDVTIIHDRTGWLDAKHNSGIFNAAAHWNGPAHTIADSQHEIADLLFERIRAEGRHSVGMRFTVLANWRDIVIRDFHVEAWNGLPLSSQASTFRLANPSPGKAPVQLGTPGDPVALRLINYRVGGERIKKSADGGNWSSLDAGRLNFDGGLWPHWQTDAAPPEQL
jgi:hypothetical protein